MSTTSPAPYRRIAAEEGWCTPELMRMYERIVETRSINDPGFYSLWGFFGTSPSERARTLKDRIQDLEGRRLRDMDELGIDMQLLMLTAPGVQVFDAATGTALAASTNDHMAETIRRHPTRFDGLAAVAPQDPQAAAKEIQRAVNQLKLKGVVINSHTQGEYLDDTKFWDIFAACEALDVPLYIHPNTPSPQMVEPFLSRALGEAIYGFACETGLHVLRMIVAGVFDRFPKLRLVLGHCGEGLPYWLYRIDFMHAGIVRSDRCEGAKPLQRTPGEVIRQNVWVTNSGMCWAPPVMYCHQVLGADRVLYAMDYPYQVVADEVRAMDALPLSDEHKKMFFQTNAEQLFRLAPRAA
jgi:2,3-dihydroxybenzoate decarboxylase